MDSKTTPKEKKKRANVAKELGLCMSLPRVRTLIQKTVNGESLGVQIKQLKSRLAYIDNGKAPKNEISETEIEDQLENLQNELIRLKASTPMAMTALIDYALRETLVATFEHCQKLDKPTILIKTNHMYDTLETKPVLTALFMLSQAFENKVHKESKKANIETAKKESKPEMTPEEKKKVSKEGFMTYIGQLIDDIKGTVKGPDGKLKFREIRVSKTLKIVLDMFTRDVLTVLSSISSNLCEINDVRTIKWEHLHKALDSQMFARHINKKDYKPLVDFIGAKVDTYSLYKANEKLKGLTDEQKKELETKKSAPKVGKNGKAKLTDEQKKEADKQKREKDRLTKRASRQTNNRKAAAKKAASAAKKETHTNGTSTSTKKT